MANLTPDDWEKMIDELTALMPEPMTPMISAVLFTQKDYLIPPGTMYKAEHENKEYFLMNNKDVEKAADEVRKLNLRPTEIYEYQTGISNMLAGIPIIEDNEKIVKIFQDAIKKSVKGMEDDLFTGTPKPRPFIYCECGGLVTHALNCKSAGS